MNLRRPISTILSLLAAVLALTSPPAHARSIAWGSSVDSTLLYSDGSLLDDNVIFELGSFGSFVPDATESNMAQWAANWKVFDRAQAPAGSGWNSTDSIFASLATLNSDGTSSASPPLSPFVFAEGEQAYIWAYKIDQTLALGGEWALITNDATDGNAANDWLFPAHADQTALPLDWRVIDANTVVFGGVNSVQGPGAHNSNPAVFDLQLHAVVPEPGSALLIAAAGFTLLLRRRTRA